MVHELLPPAYDRLFAVATKCSWVFGVLSATSCMCKYAGPRMSSGLSFHEVKMGVVCGMYQVLELLN